MALSTGTLLAAIAVSRISLSGGSMDRKDVTLAEQILCAMADAHPQSTHFGYLGLVLGANGGAMLRALRQLKLDGMIGVDRTLSCMETPYAQASISAKGLTVASGVAPPALTIETLRHVDGFALANLPQSRLGSRSAVARIPSSLVRQSPLPSPLPTQMAEHQLGTAAA